MASGEYQCPICGERLEDEDQTCANCGYDPWDDDEQED